MEALKKSIAEKKAPAAATAEVAAGPVPVGKKPPARAVPPAAAAATQQKRAGKKLAG
jgi:hypothetical protein